MIGGGRSLRGTSASGIRRLNVKEILGSDTEGSGRMACFHSDCEDLLMLYKEPDGIITEVSFITPT